MPRRPAPLAIAVVICGSAIANAAGTLTLDQAITMALENNRGLRTAVLDAEKAQDRANAARTRQYPGISVYMLGAQQLRSFDFVLEKGILGTYNGIGPL